MCAIAGIIGNDLNRLYNMVKVQQHRGPDEKKTFLDRFSGVAIGMARLSIVDLESEGLCLYKHDKYILSYNGEIYNHKEIKKELEKKGINFQTKCDTEVFLKSYIQRGDKSF